MRLKIKTAGLRNGRYLTLATGLTAVIKSQLRSLPFVHGGFRAAHPSAPPLNPRPIIVPFNHSLLESGATWSHMMHVMPLIFNAIPNLVLRMPLRSLISTSLPSPPLLFRLRLSFATLVPASKLAYADSYLIGMIFGPWQDIPGEVGLSRLGLDGWTPSFFSTYESILTEPYLFSKSDGVPLYPSRRTSLYPLLPLFQRRAYVQIGQ